MNTTRRTLALVASVLAGSGLVLIGQQSAEADVAATPCVTTTIAPSGALATATAAPSAAADAASLEGAAAGAATTEPGTDAAAGCASPASTEEATTEDGPVDNPLCDLLGHRACVDLPTEIPDPPTEPEPSTSTSTVPTDDPSSTTTTTSAPTSTGPVVPDPGTGGNNGGGNGGGNSGGGNGNGGGNGGNGNNGGGTTGGSAPTGTLGTGPVAVEGNVGSRDHCGALECANQDYSELVATRTQQNAAVPSAAAAVAGRALARTGSPISTLTTYAGGLLVGGALLLGARRRVAPGYARRH